MEAVAVMNNQAVDIVAAPSLKEKKFKGETMLVANPIYDGVFKYMVYDKGIKNLGKQPPQNEAEELLTVFDQKYCTADKRYLEIPLDDVPEKFHAVVFRLQRAALDPYVRRQMKAQDDFDKAYEKQLKKREEKGEVKGEAKATKKFEGVIAQKDQDLAQANQDLAQKDEALAQTTQDLEEERRKNQELAAKLAELEAAKTTVKKTTLKQ